jgi:transcriptional regulator with PAS, ATPase and Fis domain
MAPESNFYQINRVTFDDLSRLPVERLARLLLERASEDPMLLSRLHATIAESAGRPVAPSRTDPAQLIGRSAAMAEVTAMLRRIVQNDDPVLITGESGTGKELAARAIHQNSARRSGPFVAVNCAAIPASLVASELFGFEKGAFTGAAARTRGQLEHAQGGTLFLDEIGDMPIELQGHLLRVLQEGQLVRVGGREPVSLNVRIVSATNVRLRHAIAEGRFREDLYYRLNVMNVRLPPLRERRDDIEPLARQFLLEAVRDFDRPFSGFGPAALERLRSHDWPGNVRELRSVVRRAAVIGEVPLITAADLTGLDEGAFGAVLPASVPAASRAVPRPGSDAERAALVAALRRTGENITLTAQELGVSRVTLYRMLRRHRIDLERGLQEVPVVARGPRSVGGSVREVSSGFS